VLFAAMANHHDNFGLWDSMHHPWNSLRIGPKKDLIGGWATAAKKQGLPFGVNVHAAHAWTWYETAQRATKTDRWPACLTMESWRKPMEKANGWEGLDPQALYAQNYPLSAESHDSNVLHKQ
jgi:alpha-L-fucosidase